MERRSSPKHAVSAKCRLAQIMRLLPMIFVGSPTEGRRTGKSKLRCSLGVDCAQLSHEITPSPRHILATRPLTRAAPVGVGSSRIDTSHSCLAVRQMIPVDDNLDGVGERDPLLTSLLDDRCGKQAKPVQPTIDVARVMNCLCWQWSLEVEVPIAVVP